MPDLGEEFVPDLDGKPVVGLGGAKTNVLLVILEGALVVHQFEIERASGLGDSIGATRH